MNHLGLSGRVSTSAISTTGYTCMTMMGILQAHWLDVPRATVTPKLMPNAMTSPKMFDWNSCANDLPLASSAESSDEYVGMTASIPPTPRPITTLPASITPNAIC